MAKQINIEKEKLVEIKGNGLILDIEEDSFGRILVRVESEEGGRRIIIKQHEEDSRTIVYSLENPPQGPKLTLVK